MQLFLFLGEFANKRLKKYIFVSAQKKELDKLDVRR